MQFYKEVSVEQKWEMLREWTKALAQQFELKIVEQTDTLVVLAPQDETKAEYVCFTKNASESQSELDKYSAATVCDLATKKYRKTLSDLETLVLKSLAGNKARFYI